MTDELLKRPGLTVGQLRQALEGIQDDMAVTVRTEDFCGGISGASPELDEDGLMHFAIDCSDDEDDFLEAG